MNASDKIIIELSINEAKVLHRIMQCCIPLREDEMIFVMLYARVTRKLEETLNRKNELS